MKRLFTILSLVMLGLMSVVSCYDDSALWDSLNEQEQRITDLETRVEELNTNLISLQTLVNAMKQGDYITDVTPITENGVEIGYQITFYDHGTIKIYHGKNGASSDSIPELGVKLHTDGVYYWTINGEWVLDAEGNKLPVSAEAGAPGNTPQLKVENEKWYVSYDNGKTWTEIGSAVSENADVCVFQDVTYSDDTLTLTLAGGTSIKLSVGTPFRITFGDFDINQLQYGKNVEIPYTIEGDVKEASVFALSDHWMFNVEIVEETPLSGKIIIEQDDYYDEEKSGKIAIFASNDQGLTVTKIIRVTSGVLYPTDDRYEYVYTLGSEASQFEVSVSTNREVEVKIDSEWLTLVETKAVEEKTLVFGASENEGSRRKALVEISSGDLGFSFYVAQKGYNDSFSIEVSANEVTGGWWNVNVDTLYNKAGQTIHEALGYSSWEELAKAAGKWETVQRREGEVVLTAYDLYTGEAFTGFGEEFYNGLGFRHDAEGYLVDWWSEYCISWDWSALWEDGTLGHLDKLLTFGLGRVYAGESYSFGILFTSPEGEARIEVTANVTEYEDPEAGMYDDPSPEGRYEFTIHDKVDLDSLRTNYLFGIINREMAEHIKTTLGKTTYEIFKEVEWGTMFMEYQLNDGGRWWGRDQISLNEYGYWTDNFYEEAVAAINWNFGAVPNDLLIWLSIPSVSWDNGPIFSDAVYNAIGKTVTYNYVIYYNGYELVFTHEIEYVGEANNGNADGRCLLVASSDMVDAAWDSQLYISLENELVEGDLLEVSMDIKADNAVSTMAQTHVGPGEYLHWDAIGTVDFTTSWKTFRYSGNVASEMVGGKTIVFNLNDYQFTSRYYFDNVSIKVNGVEQIVNGSFDESDDVSDFTVRFDRRPYCSPASIVDPNGDIFGVVGTQNDWASPDDIMGEVNGMYVAYNVVFDQDDNRFKIRANQEWYDYANFGLELAGSVEPDCYYQLVCGSASGDIKVPNGVYDIWFDLSNARVYIMNQGKSISEAVEGTTDAPVIGENWYLVGSFNGWITGDSSYVMTETENWYVYEGFTASETVEMKFNVGDWSYNLGGGEFTSINEPILACEGGFNIVVPAGTYDIYLNKEETTIYFVTPGTVPEDYIVVDYVWSKKVVSELWSEYDASKKVKLAKYGDYILVANGSKVGALNPKDGSLVATYDLPSEVHSFCVDDGGNIIISTDVATYGVLEIYKVADLNSTPELLLSYNAANYYGVQTGNVRIKGNVDDDAVITAVVSDGAGGAVIMWEVVDGVASDWHWTNVPYTAWNVDNLCCAPAGSALSDGLFYIGYGGDYNFRYTADPVIGGGSEWASSYVTGSSWMENYNCISTLTHNGYNYAAILKSCHFNYDSADVVVLNVDNPAVATEHYVYAGDMDVDRDENYANLDWTGLGTYSDVLLFDAEGELAVAYVDSNYGVVACTKCN